MDTLVFNATAPIVEIDKPFVLAWILRELENVTLSVFKITRIDPHCITLAELVTLSEEEMKSLEQDAIAWCNNKNR